MGKVIEAILVTKQEQLPKNVDDVRSGTDYKNFIVDFKSNTVS